MRLIFRLTLIACLWAQASSADNNLPDLGDSSGEAMSNAQERQAGEQAMIQIRAAGEVLDDPDADDYINRLGSELGTNSADPSQHFEVFIVNDKTINAFAMPGGFVGVNSGLIVMAQNESELASVMGHEFAHVTQHHMARRLEGQSKMQVPMLAAMALAILAARNGSGQGAPAAMATTVAATSATSLSYSRDFEREADRLGMQTLVKAGFDPRAMPRFFQRLLKANVYGENSALAYLRTHPLTTERVSDAQNRADAYPYKQVIDSDDFVVIRERLRVHQMGPREAIPFYRTSLEQRKYTSELASHFGLAYALLLTSQFAEGEREIALVRKKVRNPYVESLAGYIALGAGKVEQAIALFHAARIRYPSTSSLAYGEVEALLQAKKVTEALAMLDEELVLHSSDGPLYQLSAKAYAAQGDDAREHQALAEYNIVNGNYPEALTQLKHAEKAAGKDFHLLSAIEARQREIQKAMEPDKHK